MNVPVFIARRYLLSKKSHNAINVISGISVCGVALATLALVCTLSVFNGFQDVVATFFTAFDPQLKITATTGKVFDASDRNIQAVRDLPEVAVFSQVLEDNAMVQYKDRQMMATIKGVEDNYEELTKNQPDKERNRIRDSIEEKLSAWANDCKGIVRRLDRDRYLVLLEKRNLASMKQDKFHVVEAIRSVESAAGIAVTVSIGFGEDAQDFSEALQFAEMAAELAVSRGGDQVVVKNRLSFEFYGGRGGEIEKRTKVKSRVMANTLQSLIEDSSRVFVMGHRYSDLDAIGAAVGVCCVARLSGIRYNIVVDENNKPLPSALTAEFTIRGGNGTHLSKSRTIQLSNESTKTRKDIPYRWDIKYGDTLNVAAEMISLKDASGANVMKNYDLVDPANKYKVLAKGTAIQTYTRRKYYKPLKQGTRNETTLEYTLKRLKTEKEIAELKLTKAVTYKKTPIRVNGTYYIGIFEDAAHKKILYKKAMALANASSMTSTLKINLYKLAAPHTITLYFAEVDKNGNVVTSGKKSGYDISLNKTQVTLSPTNADESVILTNDVRTGSVAAANLTNPSSGFAGDASALAEAQALSNNETVKSKPTGDDTPFEPFALATGISAAAIFLLLALLAARKKLWVK